MADAAKEKAEKLAAAKKRVEALKKQKAKKGGSKKEETPEAITETSKTEEVPVAEAEASQDANDDIPPEAEAVEATEEGKDTVDSPASPSLQQNPSLSLQSKMRSSSFRQSSGTGPIQSPGPITPGFGPDGDTASSIYLKQAAKIDELEKENKRLAKEASDGERRYKKAEEELEVLREAEAEAATPAQKGFASEEVEKLKSEIAALQRQNTQLQAKTSRHGSSPSMSTSAPSDLAAELASKSATIESMELEISNLRAQITRISNGSSASQEQITALEENLSRSQKAAELAQQELSDIKKNLERTTEKAVKEGSERISAETKLRTLERDSEASKTEITSLNQKNSALEKKIQTLTNLHKEHDTRSQTQRKEKEKIEKEAAEMRSKLAGLENENLRLREERDRIKKRQAEGIDDEGLDELEDEERVRLEKKVRDLEAEVFELRRGVWNEKRHGGSSNAFDGNGDNDHSGITSPGNGAGSGFSNIDLGGNGNGLGLSSYPPASANRRRSGTNHGKSVGQFISSGFSAFAGGITGGGGGGGGGGDENEGFLDDDDDDMEFDEEAFRKAHEEEMKARIERVKEVKRKLREWSGWRLDLVENRWGGAEGTGEIFEI